MNLLLGIIVGILLTIGKAFVADAFTTTESSNQIANWDIAKE